MESETGAIESQISGRGGRESTLDATTEGPRWTNGPTLKADLGSLLSGRMGVIGHLYNRRAVSFTKDFVHVWVPAFQYVEKSRTHLCC